MKPLLRRLCVSGAAAVVAVSSGVVPIAASQGAPRGSGSSGHERIVSFWTNDKVAQAQPRDFVYNPKTRRFERGKPGGSGGTVGASWAAGGEVLKTTGKVLFAIGSSYYVCSASTADDVVSGRSLILTAGHCVFDESTGAFATNWMFVPDYDSAAPSLDSAGLFCASTTLGCWTASALVVHSGFASAGAFNQQAIVHDFAFAVVGPGGKSGTAQLDQTVGGHPIQFSAVAGGTPTWLFGYPAAGKYMGKDLVYCQGALGFDALVANATYKVGCNMTGGSSGGPWFAPFSAGSGTLMSVNSYGYSGVKSMYGPKLNSKAQQLFAAAETATANTVVP